MKKWCYVLLLALSFSCGVPENQKAVALHQKHCGSCHLPPNPSDLPKAIWKQEILPDMGARLGIKTEGYNPMKGISWEEQAILKQNGIYPSKPKIAEADWEALKTYILEAAPDSFALDANRNASLLALKQFTPKVIRLDESPGAYITYLGFNTQSAQILCGDVFGTLSAFRYSEKPTKLYAGRTAIVDYSEDKTGHWITEIGKMPPTELSTGKLVFHNDQQSYAVAAQLHRPVHTLIEDLDQDGDKEIVISEFGNQIGQLSLLVKMPDGSYQKKALLSTPGIIRVIAKELNGDEKTDLIVLAGQGDEGVYVLYQIEDLVFAPERAIRFSPVWGSSWIELADFNSDGYPDIICVHGDNADKSYTIKPYHGLRIYINNRNNGFEEAYFYPMYGATRVVAEDFDADGDLDLAIAAYFADFEKETTTGFAYLETLDAATFSFQSYTLPEARRGRWLVMESGDVDADGDKDLILGAFAHSPAPTPKALLDSWKKDSLDLLILENKIKS